VFPNLGAGTIRGYRAVFEHIPAPNRAWLLGGAVGKMRNCGMRKVKCGMECAENYCGMVGNMRKVAQSAIGCVFTRRAGGGGDVSV